MTEIAGATVTLIGIVILYRAWKSERRQADILLKDMITVIKLNRQLQRIVVAHGCAPNDDVRPAGTTHTCPDCASTWTAQEFKVLWLDDGLKNEISQSWHLTEQGDLP
jgi:hypothetical protein